MRELPACFGRPALGEAVGEHDGVDRARARAADGVENDALGLEQLIENAPSEGAERSAALECQRQQPPARPESQPLAHRRGLESHGCGFASKRHMGLLMLHCIKIAKLTISLTC